MNFILGIAGSNLNNSINDKDEKLINSLISKSKIEQNLRTDEISINKKVKESLKHIDKLAKPIS